MIHSMAGGKIQDVSFSSWAKVELLQGNLTGKIFWFKSPFVSLKVGDEVIVPFGPNNLKVLGKVVRIDRAVSSQVAPVPEKRAKSILKILDDKNKKDL